VDAAAISFAARLVLAGVLLLAAIAKLRAPDVARRQTIALVGRAFGPAVAVALPVLEVTVASLLVVWWSPEPGVIAAVLFGAFTVIVVRAQVRGLPCPCFGAGTADTETRPSALVRNGLLLAYAVLATASPAGASPAAVVVATVVLGSGAAFAVRLSGPQRAVNRKS
jgi:hypothetical protein